MVYIIDSLGTGLTAIKSYKDPESETLITWIMSGTSGIFGMLAVGSMNFILLAYPFYITIANYVIVATLLLGKYRKNS